MRKFRDEQKGAIFIVIILLIVAVVVGIFMFSLRTDAVEEVVKSDSLLKVLFVVEDDDGSVLFSDVIANYPVFNKAAVINIPGNTGAIYRSLGRVDRIDRVYQEKGIDSYRTEVERMLGLSVPFCVVINLDCFVKLTDMLGGLRVFIPAPVDCRADDGTRWLLPSGAVDLDGDKILTYLKYRDSEETSSDVQDRYQNVMTAFLTGLHDRNFIIFRGGNFRKYAECMSCNVSDSEFRTLFSVLSQVDTESVIRQTITGSIRNVDGQQLLFPLNNGEFVKEAVKQTTGMLVSTDGTVPSRTYVLEIQNGTTVQGLARNTSILFQNASYDVLSAVNADSNDYEETVIIDHIGNEDIAKMVGGFIHCTNIRQADSETEAGISSDDARVDFTIILGKDFNGRYVVRRNPR